MAMQPCPMWNPPAETVARLAGPVLATILRVSRSEQYSSILQNKQSLSGKDILTLDEQLEKPLVLSSCSPQDSNQVEGRLSKHLVVRRDDRVGFLHQRVQTRTLICVEFLLLDRGEELLETLGGSLDTLQSNFDSLAKIFFRDWQRLLGHSRD